MRRFASLLWPSTYRYSRVALPLVNLRIWSCCCVRKDLVACVCLRFCHFRVSHTFSFESIWNIALVRICLFWQLFSYLDLTSATKPFQNMAFLRNLIFKFGGQKWLRNDEHLITKIMTFRLVWNSLYLVVPTHTGLSPTRGKSWNVLRSRFGDVNGTRFSGEWVCFELSFCLSGDRPPSGH